MADHIHQHKCLACGHDNDRVTNLNEENSEPKPGDYTVCGKCGTIARFSEDLSELIHLKEGEPAEGDISPDDWFIVNQMAAAIKLKNDGMTDMPQAVIDAMSNVAEQFRGFVEEGKENVQPVMFCLRVINDQIVAEQINSVAEFHKDETGKTVLAILMERVQCLPNSPFNALIYASEAWTVTRKDLPEEQEDLSNDPDRKEALVLTAKMFGRHPVIKLYDIDREAKTLTERQEIKDSVVHGRFFDGKGREAFNETTGENHG